MWVWQNLSPWYGGMGANSVDRNSTSSAPHFQLLWWKLISQRRMTKVPTKGLVMILPADQGNVEVEERDILVCCQFVVVNIYCFQASQHAHRQESVNVIIVLWKICPPLEILSLQDKWGEHVDLVIIYFYQTIRINFPLQPLQRECSMSQPRALIDIFTSLERERGE